MPVLSLELAPDGQHPGISAATGAAVHARRTLMLAVCCLSLFIYRANVGPGSIAQTTEAFMGFSPFLLASQARITAVRYAHA